MSLHQRQVVAAPAADPAGQLGGVEAGLLQDAAPGTGVLAHGVDQDDGRWLGQPLRWRVREEGKALLLSLVSTRPFQGRWQWSEDGEGWRLVVELQERDGRE